MAVGPTVRLNSYCMSRKPVPGTHADRRTVKECGGEQCHRVKPWAEHGTKSTLLILPQRRFLSCSSSRVWLKKFNELGPSAFCFGTCCCRADERRPVAPEQLLPYTATPLSSPFAAVHCFRLSDPHSRAAATYTTFGTKHEKGSGIACTHVAHAPCTDDTTSAGLTLAREVTGLGRKINTTAQGYPTVQNNRPRAPDSGSLDLGLASCLELRARLCDGAVRTG